MALKFYWRCEGTTLDATHDFTAGDNTAALTNAVINTDAAMYGTNGLDMPAGGSGMFAAFVVSSGDLISSAVGAFGFNFRLVSFVSGIVMFRAENTGAANNHISLEMTGTDDSTGRELLLRIRMVGGANVTLATTAADLQLNTQYFVVARWDEPNNDRRLEVYDSAGSLITAVEDLTTNYDQPSGINELRIGRTSGMNNDMHIDNVFIADAYAEALEDFYNITSYTDYGVNDYTIVVDPGSIAVQGQNIGTSFTAPVVHGQVAVQGFDVALLFDEAYVLPVEHGRVVIEGQEIPFILTQLGTHGQIAVQGQDVALLTVANLVVDHGQVTVQGQDVGLHVGLPVSLPGQIAVAGQLVNLLLSVPPTIITTSLPRGYVGQAYAQLLSAVGDPTITFTLNSGALPDGLSLAPTGWITGVPTTAETQMPEFRASNGVGFDDRVITMTIDLLAGLVYTSAGVGRGGVTGILPDLEGAGISGE